MKEIAKLFFFDRLKFNRIKDEAYDQNWRILRHFSGIAGLILAAMAFVSSFSDSINYNFPIYIIFSIISGLLFLLSYCRIKTIMVKETCCYIFLLMLLCFGIVMGTVMAPQDITLSFIVLLIGAPLIFTERAVILNSIVVLSIVVYIIAAYYTQPDDIFVLNMYDVIPYGILSMIATSLIMRSKLQSLYLKVENDELEKNKREAEFKTRRMESFITDMVKNATSEGTPSKVIVQLLEYIGTKVKAERAFICEQNQNGNFDIVYEWSKEGILCEKELVTEVPFEGALEHWYKDFDEKGFVLIDNIEDYQEKSPILYGLMKERNVKTIAIGPIMSNGKILGFYGVENSPVEFTGQVREMLEMIEFFISFMIRIRDNEKRLDYLAHHDQLTGCQNRQALKDYYSMSLDENQSMGVFMCDLNGLKVVNDSKGHDAGDCLIADVASVLSDVFGKNNVFRIGGDEFVAVILGIEQEDFDKMVKKVDDILGEKVSIGSAFKEKMDADMDSIIRIADTVMYNNKRSFYRGKAAIK